LAFKVVKYTQTSGGTSREEVTGFFDRWEAEDFVKSRNSRLTEEQKSRVKYEIEPAGPPKQPHVVGGAETQKVEHRIQPYKITAMPLKKGFIHVLQGMRNMFPQESGKISVQLEGLGEAQLKFDAKYDRVYGLTKWFRIADVLAGTIISVETLEPFKKYRFSTLTSIQEHKEKDAEALTGYATGKPKVKPRQPASESSLIVGKGGEYHVIGRLLEKKLEVYTPVADIGGIDAIVRFPGGGTKEVQVKTRTRTADRGEVFQVRAEKRPNYYIVLHIADSDDFWILPSEVFYKKASKQGKEMQLVLTEVRKKELAREGYYNDWYLLEEE
jgi:hypothetical protein